MVAFSKKIMGEGPFDRVASARVRPIKYKGVTHLEYENLPSSITWQLGNLVTMVIMHFKYS